VRPRRGEGLIERSAIRLLGRGRPRVEYAWRAGTRDVRRGSLETQMAGLARFRADAAQRYAEFSPAGPDRLSVSVDQIKALVDAAVTSEDPGQRRALAARAEADYRVLKAMQAEDPRFGDFCLFEAGRQLERLLARASEDNEPGPALPARATGL
jgi:hypothetical protein